MSPGWCRPWSSLLRAVHGEEGWSSSRECNACAFTCSATPTQLSKNQSRRTTAAFSAYYACALDTCNFSVPSNSFSFGAGQWGEQPICQCQG